MTEQARRVVARFLTAKGVGRGKTWENNKVRVHRYADFFKVWDLTNAGKRGKKVRRMSVGSKSYGGKDEWMERHARHLILQAARGYDGIKRYFETLPEEEEASIDEYQDRGIDVLPAGTRTIQLTWTIGTTNYRLEATPLEFSVVSSVLMGANEKGEGGFRQDTMYWPYKKADAKRFYGWLASGGESEVPRMNMDDLRKLWRQIKVTFDSH